VKARRVSDAEREIIVSRLGVAAAEGRLTLAEFSERSSQAYAARTEAELEVVITDLPPAQHAHPGRPLALLALTGGTIWMPLFLYLDLAAFLGVLGIVFGILGARAGASILWRAVALLGFLGGLTGIALQAVWLFIHVTN
jgi:hypothetical protein